MPSRKRPRVVAPLGALLEVYRRDIHCYERVSVVSTAIRDSWHALGCMAGNVVHADLSQEQWRYAEYPWLPLGICSAPLQTEHIDDSDDDENDEYRDQRRKIRPEELMAVKTSVCSGSDGVVGLAGDAQSETSEVKNEDDLGSVFVRLKLEPKDEVATIMARLSLAEAAPRTRARITAGIQALRGMLSGLTINFGAALNRNHRPED